MKQQSVKQIVANAAHYLALGQTEVYLWGVPEDELPWDSVASIENGGTHRLDISTDVRFSAPHPCGLTLSWLFDLEERDADGNRFYKIRVDAIRRVLKHLPSRARNAFSAILKADAEAVQKSAREYEEIAKRQFEAARFLWSATE